MSVDLEPPRPTGEELYELWRIKKMNQDHTYNLPPWNQLPPQGRDRWNEVASEVHYVPE